jgi:N6-adenosine-specific RNA methylase IME4
MSYLPPGHAPLKFHPLANLFPMLSDAELEDLGQDIQQNGQVETVKLHQGMVLDGRNRYTACTRKNIGVRTEIFEGTNRDALAWVISKNLKRRHLTESQRAMVAAKLATLRLGDNQHTSAQAMAAPIGAPSFDLGEQASVLQEPVAIVTQPEAADMMNVGRRSVQRAAVVQEKGSPELQAAVEAGKVAVSTAADIAEQLPADEQAKVAAMSQKDILAEAKRIRKEQNDARRAERSDELKRLAEASTALPTGRKFPLIYMDPPTKYAAGDSDRSTENHYPTMTENEIAALPISDLALDKAVLLIWTTVPWLAKTLRLIEGWGFEYKSCACWDKETIGLGFWWQNQHELLIAASRGSPVIPENGSILGPSLYREKKGRHSAKPEYFREMIDRVPEWKDWPKVELFPRVDGPLPNNWFGWGNQARVPKQQSLEIEKGEAA